MGEHTPFAEKIDSEVSSFAKLWRKRRWLAILLLIGVIGFGGWSFYSSHKKGERIADLERQNEKLSTALRESERENRGLRETVAPLLARAAREFPGEEINASLKKLLERLEADRIGNRALAAATITVEVIVDSDAKIGSHFMDQGGYAALAAGSDALLVARSNDSFGNTVAPREVRYRSVFQMPADDKQVGRPLGGLADTQYIQIEFAAMPEDQSILRGKVIVVFNGSSRVEFEVPQQRTKGRRIFIPNVQSAIRELLQK